MDKTCLEQELLNQLDISEQRRTGGIKPMDEQFPGYEVGTHPADILESDKIQRKNQVQTEIELRLKKLMSYEHKGYNIITQPDGNRVIAFIEDSRGHRTAVEGGKGFGSTSFAVQAAMRLIESLTKQTKSKLSGSSNEKTPHTSTVAVTHNNCILMGQRRDNGKWTFPGGGLNAGEDPHAGAVRELYEESGVRAKRLEHLQSKEVTGRTGNKIVVHCFRLALEEKVSTTSYNDPDNEVSKWEWINCPIAPEIMVELQSPKNLLLQSLGLQNEL